MNENYDDIVEQYFRSRKDCTGIVSNYVSKFENERRLTPSLTVEKFNYNQKMLEKDALEKSEKTARRILTGCLFFIVIVKS